jgi:hypothetical protein
VRAILDLFYRARYVFDFFVLFRFDINNSECYYNFTFLLVSVICIYIPLSLSLSLCLFLEKKMSSRDRVHVVSTSMNFKNARKYFSFLMCVLFF